MLTSMRALGYSFNTAVADVIDNSISANATKVDVSLEEDDSGCFLAIVDNGFGMDRDRLVEAMRYACKSSDADREKHDLGRFGLGMKTASLSQCRTLTVLSKVKRGRIHGVRWDIDRINKTKDWTLEILGDQECWDNPCWDVLESFDSGTAVHWTNFDVFKNGEDVYGSLVTRVEQLKEHLALVYHRFIAGEKGLPKVELSVGGTPLEPKDPFGTTLSFTDKIPPTRVEIPKFPGQAVIVTGYTLPHQNKMAPEELQKLGIKGRTLEDDQGFYIYRCGRLVQWGKWFGMARKAQLTKLSRIKVDVPNALDHLWELDIKKSRANPPQVIRESFGCMIEALRGKSQKIVGGQGARRPRTNKDPETSPPWELVDRGESGYSLTINRESLLYKMTTAEMHPAAKQLLDNYLAILEKTVPVIEINRQFAKDVPDPGSGKDGAEKMKEVLQGYLKSVGKEEAREILEKFSEGLKTKRNTNDFERAILSLKGGSINSVSAASQKK